VRNIDLLHIFTTFLVSCLFILFLWVFQIFLEHSMFVESALVIMEEVFVLIAFGLWTKITVQTLRKRV